MIELGTSQLGTIAMVEALALGSELTLAANVGDTTLSVKDASDFYETGGYLLLDGVIYQFTAVNGTTDTITLGEAVAEVTSSLVAVSDITDFTVSGGVVSTTLPVTVVSPGVITMTLPPGSTSNPPPGVGEAVYVWDNLAGKVAVHVRAAVIPQGFDNTGDAVDALVDPGVFPYLPLGARDLTTGEGEGCRIVEDAPGKWRLTAITGRAATYSSEFSDAIRTSGDGNAPGTSPTPTVSGGIGSLFIDWPANTDSVSLVTYDVHVSLTSGFTPSPTDLVVSTTGTYALITQLADGTPLTASTGPYYVVLVANNVDGSATPGAQATASPRTVSGPDIDVNWVYANGIQANQIEAGTISAPLILGSSLKTADSGARVEEDAAGVRIYAPDGTLVTNLSTTGTNYFSGDVDAGTLTTEGATTFLGPVEVANGVTQTLDSVFAPGTNAPSCSCAYVGTNNSGGFGGQPQEWLALNYSAAASQMYGYICHAYSGGKKLQVWTIDSNGNSVALVSSAHTVSASYSLLGGGVVGTTHWFYITDGSGNARWYNNSSGASTVVDTAGAYSQYAAGTADGTNLWTANAYGTNIVVKKWDPTNLAGGPLSTTTITKPTNFSGLWGIYVGAGDFGGSARIILSVETTDSHGTITRQMLSYGLGGTPQAGDTFNAAVAASNGGLAYDGTSFWSPCFFNVVRYEGGAHVLTSGATATWYATYTWRNDASSYESVMSSSPRVFVMQSRAAVVMNGMTVPTGADHLGFYAGPGNTRTTQWLQGESTGATITLALGQPQNLVLSGTNPPATGTFPASTPGGIVSGASDGNGPLIQFYGDGTYRLAGTNLYDVPWTSLGNSSRYCVKSGVVYVSVNNGSFTTPTATKTVISTSAIPSAYRPSGPVYSGGYFAGQVGLVEVDTDGNLYGRQNSGSSTTNVSGLVQYPVGL